MEPRGFGEPYGGEGEEDGGDDHAPGYVVVGGGVVVEHYQGAVPEVTWEREVGINTLTLHLVSWLCSIRILIDIHSNVD